MNFITAIAYIILFSFLLGLVLPWWIFVIPCFIAGIFTEVNSMKSFLAGFLAMFLLWAGYSAFLSLTNASTLPLQISEILTIPNPVALLLASAALAAVVGGFASITGHYLRMIVD